MNMLLNLESPVTTAHRAKLAYIYVRQSTAGQVRQHQESTELQYRLVDRAALFGWPKERIEVIDDDLGKSGTSSDSRGGFQRLIAEIGLGKAGLVLSLDASRLARNNHDWHQLLELCSLFGVLIADGERVYDPCAYHDRLLLGLSGIMSEAELHQIKLRLHQGERQKAARGELRVPLPAGLVYGRDGRIGFNPDEEVHARLLHLFAKFRELRSAKAVMRHFQEANFLVPVRPLDGPSPHDVVWRPASNARILQVLKNPAYAGAYVYGRRRHTPIGRRSGSRQGATEVVAIQDWPVCLKDAFPLAAADRAQIISLGEDLPKLWDAASVVERKQILRLVVKEVVLDQRPESGQVWIRIIWQTGAVSEHKVRRNVSSYRNYADVGTLEARVRDLVVARKMDREIARALNADGLLSAHGRPFSGGEVHLLRKRWNIPTVKINRTEHNPRQWPDGTYSVQGAAEALSISTQTVFKWLQKGRLSGHQITKGMPWQINLSNTQIVELRTQVRRTTLSKKEAS